MNKLIRIIRHLLHEIVVNLVPKSLRKNMLSCREVSEILTENSTLSLSQKIKLKMHLFICQCCTDYAQQLNVIGNASKQIGNIKLTPQQIDKVKTGQQQAKDQLKNLLNKKQ